LLKCPVPQQGGKKPHGTENLSDAKAKEDSPPSPRQHQADLVQWAKENKERLAHHELLATGSTGEELEEELGFEVRTLLSGSLGETCRSGGRSARGTSIF
jgi:hypothetical protein